MKKLFFVLLFLGAYCWAGEPGTSSGVFLKMPVGAKYTAMAGAGISLTKDIYSFYWNPAGLSLISEPQTGISYKSGFEGIDLKFAAYAQPLKLGIFSLNFLSVTAGDIEGFDANDNPTGNVGYYDMSTVLGFGKKVRKFSYGFNLKYIQEKLDDELGSAITADFGCIFGIGNNWFFGSSYKNAFSGLKFVKETFSLPRIFDFGIGWRGKIFGRNVEAEFGGAVPSDNDFYTRIGTEVLITKILKLRAGYSGENTSFSGLSFGIGLGEINLGKNKLSLDYAYKSFGKLGQEHHVSVIVKLFGLHQAKKEAKKRKEENPILKADAEANKKYYLSAIDILKNIPENSLYFNSAKEKTKEIKEICKERMKKAKEKGEMEKTLYYKSCIVFLEKDITTPVNLWEQILVLNPDNEEVRAFYQKALKNLNSIKKKNAKILKLMREGITFHNRALYKKAIKKFEEVLKIDPDNSKAKNYLELCRKELQKKRRKKIKSKPKEPIKRGKAEPDPAKAEKFYNEGLILYSNGHIKKAINRWQSALKFDPENAKIKSAIETARKKLR